MGTQSEIKYCMACDSEMEADKCWTCHDKAQNLDLFEDSYDIGNHNTGCNCNRCTEKDEP